MTTTFRQFLTMFLLALPASVTAQNATTAIPGSISYQGRVLDSTGAPVGGTAQNPNPVNRTVIFRVWDHPSNTQNANLIYSEQQTVTISAGEFSVLVGTGTGTSITPFGFSETPKGPPVVSIADAFNGSSRYLGVTVAAGAAIAATDNEISPRQQVVTSAFAFRSRFAESLGTSARTALTTLDSGNIGVGNASPPARFTVTDAGTGTGSPQLVITADDVTERLRIGVDSTGSGTGYIQSFKEGSGAQNLLLNPNGGNIGIGMTTAPTSRLDVNGGIKATGAGGYSFNSGDTGGGLFSPAAGVVTLQTNGSERVRVDASGNLGIGTTNPAARLSLGSTLANTKLALFDDGTTLLGMGIQGNQFRFHTGNATDRFVFLNAPNGAETMTITGNGNVGIGTNNPFARLEVVGGNAMIRGANPADNLGLTLVSSAGTERGAFGMGGGPQAWSTDALAGDAVLRASSGRLLLQSGSGPSAICINAINAVGIGTPSPADLLHVRGGFRIEHGSNGNNYRMFVDNTNSLIFRCNLTAGNNFSFLSPTSFGLISTSDRRVKKDIEPMTDCLARLMRLTPSTFRYKHASDDSPLIHGFISQDVEKQFPDLVQEKDGLKHLASAGFEGINARAIQELKLEKDAEVKALREENEALKARLAAQEKRLAGLEARDKEDKALAARLAALEKLVQSGAGGNARPVVLKAGARRAE